MSELRVGCLSKTDQEAMRALPCSNGSSDVGWGDEIGPRPRHCSNKRAPFSNFFGQPAATQSACIWMRLKPFKNYSGDGL